MRLARVLCLLAATALAACGSNDASSGAPDAGADAGGDAAADTASDSGADAGGPDATPDASADTRADAAPDATPDTTPDTTPDGADDATQDADAEADAAPDVEEPRIPVSIETSIAGADIRAGEVFRVACAIADDAGEPIPLDQAGELEIRIQPDNDATPVEGEDGAFRVTRVGDLSVACTAPELLLADTTPERVTVSPADPAEVWAVVDPHVARAGEVVSVRCSAFDAWGNRTSTDGLTPVVTPSVAGTVVDEDAAVVTRTGRYDVLCTSAGATELVGDVLDVTPDEPASLDVAVTPSRALYGLGEVVEIDAIVADRFGNPIDAPNLVYAADPPVPAFGAGRFRLTEEGIITLGVTVEGTTLSAAVELLVNGRGPSIVCDSPADGAMLDRGPGTVTLRGTVADALGVAEVTVDGVAADLNEDGVFTADVEAGWGIQYVDITATDTEGAANSTTCAFLVSDDWIAESGFVNDGVTLALGQAAIDDGSRGGSLNSLGDLLDTALDSQELVNAIDAQLAGSGRLLNECFVDLGFLGCALRATVDYESARVDGPNDVSLRLVDGGLRGAITIRNAAVRLRIGGTFSTSGWVFLNSMSLDVTFDLRLSGGVPRLTYRSSGAPDIGGIDTDFSGITGELLDFLFPLFEGTVKSAIRDGINGFVRDDLDDVLDGVVSGLDIGSLGSSFDVPRLDGGAPVALGFGLRFSTIDVNTSRALFGIGTQFSAPVTRPGQTFGAAYPPGALRLEPPLSRSVGAGVHVVLLNQAVHALWRARFFDAAIDADVLDLGLPAGSSAVLDFGLPPVVQGRDVADGGGVEVQLGAVGLTLVVPGIFDAPLTVRLGAVANASVAIVGEDELVFGDIEIEQLSFATPDASLSMETRDVLEGFLTDLLGSVLADALNDALPALPIPSFELPSSLAEYGLPGGAVLGVVAPVLDSSRTHFVVQGNFGVQ